MKKILIILTFILTQLTSFGQLIGLGTIGSPFSGTFGPGDNLVWSGNIYVDGDIFLDNEQLTISPGTTVFFTTAGADLIITGTGQLNSNGTASSQITFTKGTGNSSWGHISFQNMTPGFTGASIINNCIIEFGQKASTPFVDEARGGGINSTFSYLTISNSIIRNNYAGFGGGICVSSNTNSSISNCIITNNIAGTTGGGLLLDLIPLSKVENCIIANNTCSGGGGGGGVFIGDNSTNATFYNCTIASNISTLNRGNNVRLYVNSSSPSPKFYNTIVWGSNGSIDYPGQTPRSDDFNNCAIQGYSSGYTSCINLSATNSDPTGPNFTNPNNLDYSISFVSPCRDAGTWANAPSTDFLGKYRVAIPDIGAYEVQYSSWTGAVDNSWSNSTNWESSVDPASGSGDVIIPFNSSHVYPVAAAPDFTILTGRVMILKAGAEATFGSLVNNGTLSLESSVSGISSIIFNSYSGNPANIQLYLDGGGTTGSYKWHYISSPVMSLPVSVFSPTTLNVAKYYENLVTTDQNIGWVGYDGWIYLPTGQYGGPTFSNLDVGYGYNHYFSGPHTYTFSGSFNTSDVSVNLAYNSINSTPDYANNQGFNLLGNPFPSCLDWSQISATLDATISKAIYFNKNGGVASWVNGIGTNGGTGTIPPMQGFFVKAYAVGKSITLPISARVHNPAQVRYKRGLEIISLVRLKIEDPLNSDDAVVRFDDLATTGVDNAFDAYKFSKNGGTVDIWTTTGGADLSINAIPFPTPSVDIPVSFYTSIAGTFKISGPQIDGLQNYRVLLTDKSNNSVYDLTTTPFVSFSAPGGIITDRFLLTVGTITTALPETKTPTTSAFNIYHDKRNMNIQTLGDSWNGVRGDIRILDISGKLMQMETNTDFNKGVVKQIPVSLQNGIYFVEITSGYQRYVGKVVIR